MISTNFGNEIEIGREGSKNEYFNNKALTFFKENHGILLSFVIEDTEVVIRVHLEICTIQSLEIPRSPHFLSENFGYQILKLYTQNYGFQLADLYT